MRACWGLGPRGAAGALALSRPVVWPSAVRTASAPRLILSRLNTQPARPPVNASMPASRLGTHDSGLMWLATPSSQRTLTSCSSPVSRRTLTPIHTFTSSTRRQRAIGSSWIGYWTPTLSILLIFSLPLLALFIQLAFYLLKRWRNVEKLEVGNLSILSLWT